MLFFEFLSLVKKFSEIFLKGKNVTAFNIKQNEKN